MMAAKEIADPIARKYFLHANDVDLEGSKSCYFADGTDWGFWVAPNGQITVDCMSASGKMPDRDITGACVSAAIEFLKPQ